MFWEQGGCDTLALIGVDMHVYSTLCAAILSVLGLWTNLPLSEKQIPSVYIALLVKKT